MRDRIRNPKRIPRAFRGKALSFSGNALRSSRMDANLMPPRLSGPLKLSAQIEQWPLVAPFRITGHVWNHVDVLLVSLEEEGHVGRGEAAGVYYKNDTPEGMLRQVESLRVRIEAGLSREELQKLLPAGGAR